MRAFTVAAILGLTSAIKLREEGPERISLDDVVDVLFDAVDANGDGELCEAEGRALLDTVAGELGDEEAGEILATLAGAMDKDGSDTISLKELKGGAADAMEAFGMDPAELPGMIVGLMDTDGSGAVGLEEAMAAVEELGLDVTEEDVLELGAQLDLNGDGEVCADELMEWGAEDFMAWDDEDDEDDEDDDWISLDDVLGVVFDAMDQDGSETIDGEEAYDMLMTVADAIGEELSEEDAKEAVEILGDILDTDDSGDVCWDELQEGILDALDAFDISLEDVPDLLVGLMDTDGSGAVGLEEAMAAVEVLGLDVTEEDVIAFGKQLDANEDGEVCADELGAWGAAELGLDDDDEE